MGAYLSNCPPTCDATIRILKRKRRPSCVRLVGWKKGVPFCLACDTPYRWGDPPPHGHNIQRLDIIFAREQ